MEDQSRSSSEEFEKTEEIEEQKESDKSSDKSSSSSSSSSSRKSSLEESSAPPENVLVSTESFDFSICNQHKLHPILVEKESFECLELPESPGIALVQTYSHFGQEIFNVSPVLIEKRVYSSFSLPEPVGLSEARKKDYSAVDKTSVSPTNTEKKVYETSFPEPVSPHEVNKELVDYEVESKLSLEPKLETKGSRSSSSSSSSSSILLR